MRVEVVYALPEGEDVVTVNLAPGATAADAVAASGLDGRHPGIERCKLGIYGKVVPPAMLLADGDRVEVYRPLLIDPKEARRRRAKGPGRRASRTT
jgi:putative ubiquitin-RnfH superfamily antitoxin RatB of RatAB toxin-antitoxin module